MSVLLDKVRAETEALPPEELLLLGVELIDRALIPGTHSEQEIEQAWDVEIERRVREIEEGRAELIPWQDVIAGINAKFGWDK